MLQNQLQESALPLWMCNSTAHYACGISVFDKFKTRRGRRNRSLLHGRQILQHQSI